MEKEKPTKETEDIKTLLELLSHATKIAGDVTTTTIPGVGAYYPSRLSDTTG